jgi:hypothetical protein
MHKNINKNLQLLLLFALIIDSSSCDKLHPSPDYFCSHANKEQCESRPDICYSEGGRVSSCLGKNQTYCQPLGNICVPNEKIAQFCENQTQIQNGIFRLASYHNEISEEFGFTERIKSINGKQLTNKFLKELTIKERGFICSPWKDECSLTWDNENNQARCKIRENLCENHSSAQVHTPHHCWSKNIGEKRFLPEWH